VSQAPSLLIFQLLLWVMFAVAFGLVARRCQGHERAVVAAAWFTCGTAVVAALGLALIPGLGVRVGSLIPGSAMLALLAFGVAAHRPFGLWWSVPATAAGTLGALSVLNSFLWGLNLLGLLWLIPLLILGIAMCRTRVDPRAIN
jgi:hypothetical protein